MSRRFRWFTRSASVLLTLHVTVSTAHANSDCVFNETANHLFLQNDCSTDQTLRIPNGKTMDGQGHTIVAKDPSGAHFLGAVISNEGEHANITNVTVDARNLSNICDAEEPTDNRLVGILFENASGQITGNHIQGVNQGQSGCQEGVGIEARSNGIGRESVMIAYNQVEQYQKAGIVANGAVDAEIHANTIEGLGPISFIAQNGIQVGFGATGNLVFNSIRNHVYAPATNSSAGILLIEPGSGSVIKGNSVDRNDVGIALSGASRSHAAHNTIVSSTFVGLFLDGRTSATEQNRIWNNRTEEGAAGFVIIGELATRNLFKKNRASRHTTSGFQFGLGTTANFVLRNRSTRNGAEGFLVEANDMEIVGNRASKNTGRGFFVSGSGNRIEDNKAFHNGELDIENSGANSYASNVCRTSSGAPVDCPSASQSGHGHHHHGSHGDHPRLPACSPLSFYHHRRR